MSWIRFFRAATFLLCAGILCSLSAERLAIEKVVIDGRAQGTTYHISYFSEHPRFSKSDADSILMRLDSSLSNYKPWSLISQFNRSADGIQADDHFRNVIMRSLQIYHESKGLFDITVYPVVYAWGFGTDQPKALPDSAQVKAIMDCVGSDKMRWDGNFLRKSKPCVQLDVNGIAQGYSVDVLAAELERRGIFNYLIELGGEIRVNGFKEPGHEMMKIGIESPAAYADESAELQTVITLQRGAVTTSGTYRKQRNSGRRTYSHLMNPLTGYPLENEMISATVVAADGISADGYDNVLMSLGREGALRFLQSHPELEAYLIYRKADSTFADVATKGFEKLIHRNH